MTNLIRDYLSEELHLIILWAGARSKENKILEDIKENLHILEVYDVNWQKKNAARNFGRFYGVKLGDINAKIKECGTGSFLLLTVLDKNPDYQLTETSRGFENVNTKLFSLKEKYRKMTNGGSKIHATNSIKETNHDITLLLGKNYEDYLKEAPQAWDGKIKQLDSDLVGTNGWKDLNELFYVLNNTIEYLVLRNHECLPEQFTTKMHGDIDILVKDFQNAVLLLNAEPVTKYDYRVHYSNTVNEEKVFWDIRYLGDNYYCKEWEKSMLAFRILNEKGIYIQDEQNYLYSLIYHALIHKKKIASDYYEKVENLYAKVYPNVAKSSDKYPFDSYYQLLKKFMKENCYIFTKPEDKSVYYNHRLINSDEVCSYLNEQFNINDVKPYMINNGGASECIYFIGKLAGEKLFIKWGGWENVCKNEYKFAKKLYGEENSNFIRPYFYRCDKKEKFFAQAFVEGENLKTLIENNQLTEKQKENIFKQICHIAEVFLKCKVSHRDIRPENFMLTENNQLKLIDTQFAVSTEKYKENRFFRKHHRLISGLGAEYALGKFKWDDIYSLTKIMDYIGVNEKNMVYKNKLIEKIGLLRVSFSIKLLLKIKLSCCISKIIPIKSLRHKLRGHYGK